MSSIKTHTPRPTPKFFLGGQTFSTKKERCTPRDNPPPRPPGKSCPPVSRVFSYRPATRAQIVSFKESDSSMLSKCYDESSKLLYFDQCFEVICKLGSGSFGDVYKVRCKEDGKCYAVKRSKERFKGKFDRQRKLEEVQKHEQLPKHINCISFYKAWEEKQYLYIQTELCEISLSQYAEQNHDIPEHLVWNYLVDLLLALKHLHDHNLIHLDIKPDNIFISHDGICKLGDFGLVLDLSKEDLSDAIEGDPKYLAAELMEGKFSKAADIFSLGITILELACDLDLPTGDAPWHQLRRGHIPPDCLSHLSPELAKVICAMMEPDYNKRPTVDQILAIIKYPQKYFASKEKPNTPARSARPHPPEWDFSCSDEDVFEDEAPRPLETSLGNSSSDSKNSSFNNHSVLERLTASTPGRHFSHKIRVDSSPVCSPNFKWKLESPYMSSSPMMKLQRSPLSSVKQNGLRTLHALNIEPKNLMDVFDAESDDD